MLGSSFLGSLQEKQNSIYFEHPHPKAVIAQEMQRFPLALNCLPCSTANALQEYCSLTLQGQMLWGSAWARAGHDKDTLPLSTAEILFGHTAGMPCHGHCRDTVVFASAGILCCWALQEYSAVTVGHCRETVLGWALQGYLVGHCRDSHRLGTAGIPCSWALQRYSVVGHCRDPLRLNTAGIITQRQDTAGIFAGWAPRSQT